MGFGWRRGSVLLFGGGGGMRFKECVLGSSLLLGFVGEGEGSLMVHVGFVLCC